VSDAEAFEHYDDPANREPAPGPPRRRRERPLTQHVPVRFSAETIDEVRRVAEAEGMSVSAWIRRTVERTLRQRDSGELEIGHDTRLAVEQLQRDVAELAAALRRSGSS
jgi:hypothetical protein